MKKFENPEVTVVVLDYTSTISTSLEKKGTENPISGDNTGTNPGY